jgi:polygalacturonase
MSTLHLPVTRRKVLQAGLLTSAAACSSGSPAQPGLAVSVQEFGAVPAPGRNNTRAIQRAIDHVQARGGGVVMVPGPYECGIITLGDGVTIRGQGGVLVNARIVIPAGRANCGADNLQIIDRRGDSSSYALDVSGRNCTFTNLTLVKDPIAGGYQMYLRQPSSHCRFEGLRLRGSNGILVAGHDHLFERFDLESTMSDRVGGDDAFAIKAVGEPTANITIRNGIVRGFYAIASFGSEIGTPGHRSNYRGVVRNVSITDVVADRCESLVFFKPGALIYDWRNGVIEGVRLARLRLTDERGERFTSGVRMIAARGAIIRDVVGRQLEVRARARNQGVQPTAAIDLTLLHQGEPARLENVDLQMTFVDPYSGAEHGAGAPGFPVDHIVRIEKANPQVGRMSGISIDVSGRGSRFGGVYIGAGLDDAVTLRRAHLARVGLNPPASTGGGGIWSDSRVRLGDISVDSPVLPRFSGRALQGSRN